MLLPKKIGPFTLMRQLATDGVSESFVAILDEPAGKQVVVHRLFPWVSRDPARLQPIEARVQDLTGIRHPGLVAITDYVVVGAPGSEDRFIVSEHVEGVDLGRVLKRCRETRTPIPQQIFLHFATQICNSLEALHGRPGKATGAENVLHMGLKPESILLAPDGKLLISGYGLVRSPTGLPNTSVSESGGHVPAVQYLSPEQTQPDQKLSPASDIFALGTLLYEMLTLESLFHAESSLQTIHRVRRAEVTTPLLRVKEQFPGLDKVLYRALSLNPRHRYQRAFVLREDLRGLMSGFSFNNIAEETRLFLLPFTGAPAPLAGPSLAPPPDSDPETSSLIDGVRSGTPFGDDTASLIRKAQGRNANTLVPDNADLLDDDTGETSEPSAAQKSEDPNTGWTRMPPPGAAVTTWEEPAKAEDPNTGWTRIPTPDKSTPAPAAAQPPVAPPVAAPVAASPQRMPTPVRPAPVPDKSAFEDELRTEPRASLTPAPAPVAVAPPVEQASRRAASAPPPPRRAEPVEVDEDEPVQQSNSVTTGILVGGGLGAVVLVLVAVVVCAGIGGGAAFFGQTASTTPVTTVPSVPGTPVVGTPVVGTPAVEAPPTPAVEPTASATPETPSPTAPPAPASATVAALTAAPISPAFMPGTTSPVVRSQPSTRDVVAVTPSTPRTTSTSRTTPPRTTSVAAFNVAPPEVAPIDDEGLIAAVQTPQAGPLADYSARAHEGALSDDDRAALRAIKADNEGYSRSRVLLYEDAKARGDNSERKTYLDAVMEIPENQYNPALLAEQSQVSIERKDWRIALERATLAERQWQRLPPDLVFSRKAMIYECQAAAYQGLFYDSGGEDLDSLDQAVRAWEKYKRHVDAKSRTDLSMKADDQLAKLTDMQRRLE